MTDPTGRLPRTFETDRLYLRPYSSADAPWYYRMSLRNREHLRRYESGNVAMSLASEEHTRSVLDDLSHSWDRGVYYFVGAFDKQTSEFVAQIYVGPFSKDPIEYIIGYFAEVEHEGNGFVSEAVRATVNQVFARLNPAGVRIHCDETNVRSRHVAERSGFRLHAIVEEERLGPEGTMSPCHTAIYLRMPEADDSR